MPERFNIPIGNISNSTDIKIGDNRVINKTTTTVNVQEAFDKLEQAIPEQERAEVAEKIQPLRTLASLPPEAQETPDSKEQANKLYSDLKPYLPKIGKALLRGSAAAFKAMASSNPIIAGLIAACSSFDEGN